VSHLHYTKKEESFISSIPIHEVSMISTKTNDGILNSLVKSEARIDSQQSNFEKLDKNFVEEGRSKDSSIGETLVQSTINNERNELKDLTVDENINKIFLSFFSKAKPTDFEISLVRIQYSNNFYKYKSKDKLKSKLGNAELDELKLIQKNNDIQKYLKMVSKFVLRSSKRPKFSSTWKVSKIQAQVRYEKGVTDYELSLHNK
jgi:hypothetical protein